MRNKSFFYLALALFFLAPLHADSVSRRANITGGGGPGRCTLELNVDHSAEVEIFGDTAKLRTTGGQPAFWRRFDCNVPLPGTPRDFRISRINGRGLVRLLKDPSSNQGTAVIHVSDPKGGRGVYSLDLTWRTAGSGWEPGPGSSAGFAIRRCQDAVTYRLNRDGFQITSFGRLDPVDRSGPNGWITGVVTAKRGFENRRFSFGCSVDLRSGQVRHVDVRRPDSFGSYQ